MNLFLTYLTYFTIFDLKLNYFSPMLKPNEHFKVSILQDTGRAIGILIWINPFIVFYVFLQII
jgi:hypothetical protein